MNTMVTRLVASLGCGTLFGLGLAISGMADPTKVRGFLDLFGAWDPTLVFVLAGAVIISTIGFRLAGRRAAPMLSPRFEMPTNRRIDLPLLTGAALFGVGWGLSGYCPGPAIASLTFAGLPVVVFVAAMLAGMLAFKMCSERAEGATPRPVTLGLNRLPRAP